MLIGGAVLLARRSPSRAAIAGARSACAARASGRAVGWSAAVLARSGSRRSLLVAIFGEPPKQEITEEIKAEDGALALAGYIGLTCLIAPIAEELFFRGLLFPVLRSRARPGLGRRR